jgi:hypothetical protein
MQQQKQKDNTSGKIRIDNNVFYWDYKDENILQVDIGEILIIGEYTNSDGPWFEDWFLTFVTKDGQWQSVPMYADKINDLLDLLCNTFDPGLRQNFLTGSTDWDSAILYPVSLKGKQLFELTPTETFKEPKTFFDKLLSSIGLGGFDTTKHVSLTEEAKNELTNTNPVT